MKLFDSTIVHADLTIVHGNNKLPKDKSDRVRDLHNDPKAPGPTTGDSQDEAYFRAVLEHIRKKVLR